MLSCYSARVRGFSRDGKLIHCSSPSWKEWQVFPNIDHASERGGKKKKERLVSPSEQS